MSRRPKRQKLDQHGRNKRRFVQIDHSVIDCAAFHKLGSNSVKLLLAIWRRHNSYNNGEISFSITEAIELLGCGNSQAMAAFRDLGDHGFLVCERGSSFGQKTRRAREWRLTTERYKGQPPSREYLRLSQNVTQKQNTVTGAVTNSSRSGNREPKNLSHDSRKTAPTVPGAVTVSDSTVPGAVTPIYTMSGRGTRQTGTSSDSSPVTDSRPSVCCNRIVEMRKQRNMTQEELARILRISRSYLAAIEQGRRPLSKAMFERLVNALVDEPLARRAMLSEGRRR